MPVSTLRREDGFTLFTVIATLLIVTMFSVAAFAAVDGDVAESGHDVARKQALAAAEAGVADYRFHLNQDEAYWQKCTAVPAPNAVNDAWDGTGNDPRRWRTVPSSTTEYAIELLPVASKGFTRCEPGANVAASMIDPQTRSLRLRVTGRARSSKGTVKRSLIVSLKRSGFLDFLYFTDYETSDPAWYGLQTGGRPTGGPQGDIVTWAATACKWWRSGRSSASWSGTYTDTGQRAGPISCTQIQFAPTDRVAGPLHTNDDLYTCNSPTFGRKPEDRIESGASFRTACGGGARPKFDGTFVEDAPTIGMPATNASLASIASPAYTFTGRTQIVLGAAGVTVNGVPRPYPTNGVIYVRNGVCGKPYQPLDPYGTPAGCGDAYVSGTYGANLTIATQNDIVVNGDIVRSGDTMLGLIADGFVRVEHQVIRDARDPRDCKNPPATKKDRRIDAAILSLLHSFTVDNYYCGSPLGTLTVSGVIAQRYRGPVGTGDATGASSGYIKDYGYDDRLAYRAPPYFLDAVRSSWRLARHTEQRPAR